MTQPVGSGMPPTLGNGTTVLEVPPAAETPNVEITPRIGEPMLAGENPDLTADYIFCNNLYVKNIFQQGGGGGGVTFPLQAPNITIPASGYASIPESPPYTFSADPHTGIYSNGVGKLGIMLNWVDGTNEGMPTMQFQPYKIDGTTPDSGGRAISLGRSTGFGWTGSNSELQDLGNESWRFFFGTGNNSVLGLAMDDDQNVYNGGVGLRIYQRYDRNRTNFEDGTYLEFDCYSSADTAIITTSSDHAGDNAELDIAPSGPLMLGTGYAKKWGFKPTENNGDNFVPFNQGIQDLGTSGYNLRTIYSNAINLGQTGTAFPNGLRGGTGVPAAGTGVNGDFWFRYDGGGAGATHLYFKNAGAWIGIA
jgi:hypothetical protein